VTMDGDQMKPDIVWSHLIKVVIVIKYYLWLLAAAKRSKIA
jgi:hypothetical protein